MKFGRLFLPESPASDRRVSLFFIHDMGVNLALINDIQYIEFRAHTFSVEGCVGLVLDLTEELLRYPRPLMEDLDL